MIRKLLKKLLGETICECIRTHNYKKSMIRQIKECFRYDYRRFMELSGTIGALTHDKARSQLIMTYHILEKGLTMPNRRVGFGRAVVRDLMSKIDDYVKAYGLEDSQVRHAIGVIKAYHDITPPISSHAYSPDDDAIEAFLTRYPDIEAANEPHMTRKDFYANKNAPFPVFAHSRHTLRHYSDFPLSIDRIKRAVEITRTTPTACNRQYCRVYCLCDKEKMVQLLGIQAGARGFGHAADKILLVTVDLEGVSLPRERNDVFTNGGMFLMNLCYALYHEEIAHCILNWSTMPDDDMKMRQLVPIKEAENIVAILSCGEPPDEFDVAASPRIGADELLRVI